MVSDKELEKKTYSFLLDMYVEFINGLKLPKNSVYLNKVVLREVAKRYSMDIGKIHACHPVDKTDCHKISGFLTYWISKLKPITIIDVNLYLYEEENGYTREQIKKLLGINEYFSLFLAIGRIKSVDSVGREVCVTENFVKYFLYLLRFRVTTGENLAIMYYFIDTKGVCLSELYAAVTIESSNDSPKD